LGVLAAVCWLSPGHAELEVESRGEVGTESRVFWPDDTSQTDAGNVALVSRLQVDAEVDALDELSARLRVFTRLDAGDARRRLIVPEELFVNAELEPLQLRVGYQMLNWTATEAFHPADILNSRILDGSFENPEKLGELMVAARVEIPGGNVELFAMPLFTAPVHPSSRSALGLAGPGVQLADALILTASRELTDSVWQPQWALRVQQTWGDADLSLHLVHHIDRQAPLVMFDPAQLLPRPVFQSVTQVGGTYSHVLDETLLKLEAAYRTFARPGSGAVDLGPVPARDHVVVAVGAERVVGLGAGSETSLILEGQAMLPTQSGFPASLEPLFQHDVLLGARHSFNDEQSTAVLATLVVDVTRPEQLVANVSLSRRLGEVWGLTFGARLFNYPPANAADPITYEHLHGQHQLYLDIKRYF
jgi:hypothetical protein